MGEDSCFERKAFCKVSPFDICASPDLRKALDNFVSAPLGDIAKKLGASSVVSKVGTKTKKRSYFCRRLNTFWMRRKAAWWMRQLHGLRR